MALDKEVFKEQMGRLYVLYNSWRPFDGPKEKAEVLRYWYREFKDYSNEEFKKGVDRYIARKKYPPTVSELKSLMVESIDHESKREYIEHVKEKLEGDSDG